MDESGLIACETPMEGVQPICRVLIVDDHVHVRKVIMRLLDERGYLVSSASDGRQAMEQIKASTPDVVMLDTALPGISGLDILDEIRRQNLDVAVILMATHRADKIAGDALRHGADDYLHLPVELNDLDVVFERTIQRLTLRRQNVILRRQLEEKGQLLEKELTRAAQVQSRMIPREMPQLDGFELAARFIPARQVAGDFYDWQMPVPGILTLMFGDVMGKGMSSALVMATARAALRAVVRASPPGDAMRYVSAALGNDMEIAERFITLFLARLDVTMRHLTYVDAGHGYAFIYDRAGNVKRLLPRGLPFGVLQNESYQQGEYAFQPGDALVLFSDGLVDACPECTAGSRAVEGICTALLDRLTGATGANDMVNRLVEVAEEGELVDDLTIMVLYCRGDE